MMIKTKIEPKKISTKRNFLHEFLAQSNLSNSLLNLPLSVLFERLKIENYQFFRHIGTVYQEEDLNKNIIYAPQTILGTSKLIKALRLSHHTLSVDEVIKSLSSDPFSDRQAIKENNKEINFILSLNKTYYLPIKLHTKPEGLSLEDSVHFKEDKVFALQSILEQHIENENRIKENQEKTHLIYKLSRIVNNLPVAMIAIDNQGIVQYMNTNFEKMFRLKSKPTIGQPINLLFHDKKKLLDIMLNCQDVSNYELCDEQEGGYCPISISVHHQKDENQICVGKIIVVNDITNMKKMENELLQSEQHSTLGVIAAGVAHEIRNPLSSLKMFAQIMKTKHNDKEFWLENSSIITDEIDRLEQLVGDFLNLAKRGNEKKFVKVKLDDVLRKVINLVELQIKNKPISLIQTITALPAIYGDEAKLIQVFLNLLINSVQAIPKEQKGTILLSTKEEGQTVIVTISDNGSGIPSTIKAKLFDPFITTKKDGSGLGLAISKKIVAQHKGRIDVTSSSSLGTEFKVTLPIDTQRPA